MWRLYKLKFLLNPLSVRLSHFAEHLLERVEFRALRIDVVLKFHFSKKKHIFEQSYLINFIGHEEELVLVSDFDDQLDVFARQDLTRRIAWRIWLLKFRRKIENFTINFKKMINNKGCKMPDRTLTVIFKIEENVPGLITTRTFVLKSLWLSAKDRSNSASSRLHAFSSFR